MCLILSSSASTDASPRRKVDTQDLNTCLKKLWQESFRFIRNWGYFQNEAKLYKVDGLHLNCRSTLAFQLGSGASLSSESLDHSHLICFRLPCKNSIIFRWNASSKHAEGARQTISSANGNLAKRIKQVNAK